MEQLLNNNQLEIIVRPFESPRESGQRTTFIEANTVESSFREIQIDHIIPVFVKDNEPLISQADFINATSQIVNEIYSTENISEPSVRLSHPIKGRVPEAKDKPAIELLEGEKTLYFERMMFAIDIPTIQETIDGNSLSLTIGGVKAYSQDNLYGKKGTEQHFKVFIGSKNTVCTNLCVWTDGYMGNLRVNSIGQLQAAIKTLLESYNQNYHLHHLKQLCDYSLTEKQFALLIGRCRMYQHLPAQLKKNISPLLFGDNQIGAVCKDYFQDNSFCKDDVGNINLWRLYNLFTGTNKSSYIDSFLDRSVNAYNFTEQIKWGLEGKATSWYLN